MAVRILIDARERGSCHIERWNVGELQDGWGEALVVTRSFGVEVDRIPAAPWLLYVTAAYAMAKEET